MAAIPFEMPSAQIPFVVVDGRLNGSVPARILVDTGAAAPFPLLLSPEVAAQAQASVDEALPVAADAAVGAGNVDFRSGRLAEFALGPVRLQDVPIGITSALAAVSGQIGVPVDAVVGFRFLDGRTIAVDYGKRTIDFEAGPGDPALATPFEIGPAGPLTLVQAHINGRGPFRLALDTAASGTVVSPALAKAAGIEASESVRLAGAGGMADMSGRVATVPIRLGDMTVESQRATVADMIGPIASAAGTQVDGVLGASFFGTGRIVIDYATRRLWFTPAEESP